MKPKNFSRKKFICSCTTNICFEEKKIDEINVKYEVIPYKKTHKITHISKHKWTTTPYWGEYNKVVELPELFKDMIDGADYTIKVDSFSRDNVLMPYISQINIFDKKLYENLKTKEIRKNKLLNIKN